MYILISCSSNVFYYKLTNACMSIAVITDGRMHTANMVDNPAYSPTSPSSVETPVTTTDTPISPHLESTTRLRGVEHTYESVA